MKKQPEGEDWIAVIFHLTWRQSCFNVVRTFNLVLSCFFSRRSLLWNSEHGGETMTNWRAVAVCQDFVPSGAKWSPPQRILAVTPMFITWPMDNLAFLSAQFVSSAAHCSQFIQGFPMWLQQHESQEDIYMLQANCSGITALKNVFNPVCCFCALWKYLCWCKLKEKVFAWLLPVIPIISSWPRMALLGVTTHANNANTVFEYVFWQKSECECIWSLSKWNSFTKYYNAYALAALISSLCRKTPSSSTHFILKTAITTQKIRSPDICTVCCTWTSYHIDKNTSKAFVFLQTGCTVVWKERLYEHIKVDTVTAPWLVVKIS